MKKVTHDFVEVYMDEAGEFRWRRKNRNGKILSDSGEGYKRKGHCLKMAARCNKDVELLRILVYGDDPEAFDYYTIPTN